MMSSANPHVKNSGMRCKWFKMVLHMKSDWTKMHMKILKHSKKTSPCEKSQPRHTGLGFGCTCLRPILEWEHDPKRHWQKNMDEPQANSVAFPCEKSQPRHTGLSFCTWLRSILEWKHDPKRHWQKNMDEPQANSMTSPCVKSQPRHTAWFSFSSQKKRGSTLEWKHDPRRHCDKRIWMSLKLIQWNPHVKRVSQGTLGCDSASAPKKPTAPSWNENTIQEGTVTKEYGWAPH
jgi:hypothetical protein